ncbi:MAG: class II fructose-bisphosphate aldolase [Lentisphaerae bacterium]|nr:class II fructose-bisphosphate aldolase [Lentisphaerota bacterium]
MAVITDRAMVEGIMQDARESCVSVAMFCSASAWNNEAILMAAQRFGKKHGIKNVPVIVGMTGSYEHMPQCRRATYSLDLKAGFLSIINSLKALAGEKDSPYYDILVMPQLDHGDPVGDKWILEEGIKYLSGVLFDCQRFSFEENIAMTSAYVKKFSGRVMVEAIMETLSVIGTKAQAVKDEHYVDNAVRYAKKTGTDFLVADLGTEQQSTGTDAVYLKDRARMLTEALGRKMLVLHGVSSLKPDQIKGLASDGVVKVNMWTRIVREAGIYAAEKIREREPDMAKGDFDACDPQTFINDAFGKAVDIMEEHLAYFNYGNLAPGGGKQG